jgi:hypothetical protein
MEPADTAGFALAAAALKHAVAGDADVARANGTEPAPAGAPGWRHA